MSEEYTDTGRSPLEEALNTLRTNPEIITKIADAIGMGAPDGGNAERSPSEDAASQVSSAALPEDLLEKLPLVMSALGQSGGFLGGGMGKLNLGALMGDAKKTALLKALCPYLSPARRETAEGILRLWSVGDVLRKL